MFKIAIARLSTELTATAFLIQTTKFTGYAIQVVADYTSYTNTNTEPIFYHNPDKDTFVRCGLCGGTKFPLSWVFIIQS